MSFLTALITNAQTVSITSSVSGAICSGTNVIFTANTTGFSNPYYQWYANGTAITGATSSTYSSTSLLNGDQVNVKVNEGPFGGDISSNGLLLNLDAAVQSSYSGSGLTWNNIGPLGNSVVTDFQLTSTNATYSSDYGGVIRFSSAGGWASSTTGFPNLSSYSVEVWVRPGGTRGDYDPSIAANTNYTPCFFSEKVYNEGAGNRVNMVLAYNARGLTAGTANNSYRYEAAINNGSWKKHQIATDYSTDLNNWVQIVSVYNGSTLTIYRNGVSLGTSSALGISSLRQSTIGYYIAHRWDMTDGVYGDYSKVMMYNKALSASEVTTNYSAFSARFVDNSVSSTSITTTVNASPSVPSITVLGDGCVNKTSLTTPSGLTSYAWYKDNVVISGATINTYSPIAAGSYQVQVTSGSCSNTSTATTIYSCGKNSDGRMTALESSTTLVSAYGAINSGKGVDDRGMLLTNLLAPTGTNPITNGLVLYLDATRPASYSGTGTIWNDISGQNNTATLVGNPALSSNPASFTFATNTYASTAKSDIAMSSATFIAWVNPSQIQTGLTGIIFNRSGNFGSTAPATGLDFSNNNAIGYHWNDLPASYNWNSGISVPINTWSLIALTITSSTATVYLFNANSPSGSSAVNTLSHTALSGLNFIIANEPGGPGRTFLGKIGTSMVYTTALSSADITSIFNAQKAAFGL